MDILNLIRHKGGFGIATQCLISVFNVMAIHDQHHEKVSKQTMLLAGVDVALPNSGA